MAGPPTPVNKQQRNRPSDVALLVNVVDIERPKPFDIDVTGEHRQRVQGIFRLAPVEAILPVFHKPLDMRERNTVVPTCAFELIWETGKLQLLLEEVKFRVWDRDGERPFFGARHEVQLLQGAPHK